MRSKKGWSASLVALGLLSAVFVPGCKDQKANASAETRPEGDASAQSATTRPIKVAKLDESQVRHVRFEPLHDQPIPVVLNANGKVQFNEDREALILAPLAGQVLNLNVKVGDEVHQGDTLFMIKSKDVAGSIEDYLQARQDLELAQKTCTMTKDLYSHQATSAISLQQAENDLAKAKTHVARTTEQLRILDVNKDGVLDSGELNPNIPIKSPITGTVVERHVTEKQYVQGDSTALLTIADLSTVWVLADIFERDLHLVKVGQRAEVTTLAYPSEKFKASLTRMSNVVDPTTRTVKARFLVSNADYRLKPEMFASIQVCLDESARGITVPKAAVFTEGGESYVFVRTGDKEFADREVVVSPLVDGRLHVRRGLKVGDEVVTEGAMLLRSHGAQGEADD